MAADGQTITITTAATLVYEVIDEPTYNANGYNPTDNPQIFKAHEAGDSLPILISLPSGSTLYFGGSTVTNAGCAVFGPTTIAYNAVGSDSLYACTGSSTVDIGLLVLRQ